MVPVILLLIMMPLLLDMMTQVLMIHHIINLKCLGVRDMERMVILELLWQMSVYTLNYHMLYEVNEYI